MCRHLAYVGEPVDLADLLYDSEHSLEEQSYAPRLQRHSLFNGDGWGIAWWAAHEGAPPGPARYRTSRPMWADTSFRGIARHLRSGTLIAAVRSATPGSPVEESGNAPFVTGPWAFSHNGSVEGFRLDSGHRLRSAVSSTRERGIFGATDSEVVFSLVLDAMDAGRSPVAALASVVSEVLATTEARLNLLLCDGTSVHATRAGETLWVGALPRGPGVIVASEPGCGGEDWVEVPDMTVTTISTEPSTPTPTPTTATTATIRSDSALPSAGGGPGGSSGTAGPSRRPRVSTVAI